MCFSHQSLEQTTVCPSLSLPLNILGMLITSGPSGLVVLRCRFSEEIVVFLIFAYYPVDESLAILRLCNTDFVFKIEIPL